MSSPFTQWLYHLQHRLSITRREGLAILSLLVLFLGGLTARYVQMHVVSLPAPAPIAAEAVAGDGALSAAEGAAVPDSLQGGEPEREGASPVASTSSTDASIPEKTARIDLNTATASQLEALSGIGPALAGRIIEHRARRPFRSVEDLTQVRGIGDKTLARLRDQVKVKE